MTINGHNHTGKMQRCEDYIQALEEERRKIQVFERELPLCLELVTQAIDTCKQQLSATTTEYNLNLQSECSEQISSEAPVLEEFIPIKRASSHSDIGEHQQYSKKPKDDDVKNVSDKSCKKSDWLRSVQLWNQSPDPLTKDEDSPRKVVTEVKRSGTGGAFHPFKKEVKNAGSCDAAITATPPAAAAPLASTSSTAGSGGSGGGGGNKKEGQCQRKSRRCWSPELHKRFLQSLQQLGGSHLATPKQIRELMKVDGLTNDEVKSHLQKYRLHTRRPSSSVQHNTNNTQAPQFVVVGGIWVPPEYATMATTATSGEASGVAASTGVYAPIASLPTPFREGSVSPKQRQGKPDDHSEGGAQSHSSATSSSTHTTTALQAY